MINILKTDKALKEYTESFKVDITNKSLNNTLEDSKVSLKELLSDLLYEKKDFKYVITVTIKLKKEWVMVVIKSSCLFEFSSKDNN